MDALLIKQDIIFDDIISEKFDTAINNLMEDNTGLFANKGSGSGGYAHHIFCHAAHELFDIDVDKVEFKPLKFVLFI